MLVPWGLYALIVERMEDGEGQLSRAVEREACGLGRGVVAVHVATGYAKAFL